VETLGIFHCVQDDSRNRQRQSAGTDNGKEQEQTTAKSRNRQRQRAGTDNDKEQEQTTTKMENAAPQIRRAR
jgi:hypothetical protein